MFKRNITLLVLGLLTLSGLFSCDRPGQKSEQLKCKKIIVADMFWPASTAFYAAIEKGWFKDEGLDVELHPYATGQLALAAALNGLADLAMAAETPIAYAAIDGEPVTVAATIAEITPGLMIVARKDRGVLKPDDLKGKIVGVTLGTAAEFFVHIYLTTSYIDPAEVRIVNVQADKLDIALLEGEVDAVCVWFPHTLGLREKLGSNASILSDPNIYTMTWNLTAREDWLEHNSACVKKLLRALVRADRFVAGHPDKALLISLKYVDVKRELLEKEWPNYTFAVKLDQSLILNLEDQTRWILGSRADKPQDPPNFLDIINIAGLMAVAPEAVTIIGK